jgi:hypothetical protein
MTRIILIFAAVALFSTAALANLIMAPKSSAPPVTASAILVPGFSVINGSPSSTGWLIPGDSVVRFN